MWMLLYYLIAVTRVQTGKNCDTLYWNVFSKWLYNMYKQMYGTFRLNNMISQDFNDIIFVWDRYLGTNIFFKISRTQM